MMFPSQESSTGAPSVLIDGRYAVISELGRGGMGVVYLAQDLQRDAEVVVKKILGDRNDPDALERFRREARTLAAIRHPGVVRLVGFGEDQGMPYLAMERVPGRELKSIVEESLRERGEPPPLDWVCAVMANLADALAACHENGVIHRDVKPANILVDGERAVLVDFGLVRAEPEELRASYESLTKTGQALGTPNYMAPEQLDPSFGELGPRTDSWSLAATLFFALTGRPPFQGNTAINVYHQLLRSEAPPLSSAAPKAPAWLEALCDRCLQKRSVQRPSVARIAAALRNPEGHELTQGRRRSRALPLLVALGAIAATTLGLLSLRGTAPSLPRFDPIPAVSKAKSLKISGRAIGAETAMVGFGLEGQRLSRRPAKVDAEGRWSLELPLKHGNNLIAVFGVSGAARSPAAKTSLRCDQKQPLVRISAAPESPQDTYLPGFLVTGTVSEEGCVAIADGKEQSLTGKAFRLLLRRAPGRHRLEVLLRDAAGNETLAAVSVTRPPVLVVGESTHPSAALAPQAKSLAAALARCSEGSPRLRIVLGPGSYEGALDLRRPVELLGAGPDKTTFKHDGQSTLSIASQDVLVREVAIENGCRTVQPPPSAVFLTVGAATLRRCRIRTKEANGVTVGQPAGKPGAPEAQITLDQIELSSVGGTGLVAQTSGRATARRCQFIDCGSSPNARQGFLMELLSPGNILEDCLLAGGLREQVVNRSSGGISLRRCHFLRAQGTAIYTSASSPLNIEDCRFLGGDNAIHVIADAQVSLRRTKFIGCRGRNVVELSDGCRFKIDDCEFALCKPQLQVLRIVSKARGSARGLTFERCAGTTLAVLSSANLDLRESELAHSLEGILLDDQGSSLTLTEVSLVGCGRPWRTGDAPMIAVNVGSGATLKARATSIRAPGRHALWYHQGAKIDITGCAIDPAQIGRWK